MLHIDPPLAIGYVVLVTSQQNLGQSKVQLHVNKLKLGPEYLHIYEATHVM